MKRFLSSRRIGLLTVAVVAATLTMAALAAVQAQQATVSFDRDLQSLFNNQCVFCHMTGAESGGLNLEPGLAYEYLVNAKSSQADMRRVEPGDPEASYLLHKLQGTHVEVGGRGNQMPLGGMLWSEEQLNLLRHWILEGAPNN